MSWIKPDWPAPAYIHALTTTRSDGFSQGAYGHLNLGLHVNDDAATVEKNRQWLYQAAKLPELPRWLTQYHSTVVLTGETIVNAPKADASYTTQAHVVLAIMTADCLPILICHPEGKVIAAIHAGWRGLLDGIIHETIQRLPVPANECMAWLGPAISSQAYEMGDEVRALFLEQGACLSAFSKHNERWHMDLYALAREQLQKQGLSAIYGGNYCTYQESERFYSYRRDGVTGRMASLIWLDPIN